MSHLRRWARFATASLALALPACQADVSESLGAVSFDAAQVTGVIQVVSAAGVADEAGGGMFLSPDGAVVRLRLDGALGGLEAHPDNPFPVEAASALWPLGPRSALVVAANGLFVAENGWVSLPTWAGAMAPDGVLATALGEAGVAWVAHRDGLFRLRDGVLSELRPDGASLGGITHLAAAPSEDGAPALWFVRDGKLQVAVQQSATAFAMRKPSLGEGETRDLQALVALSPSSERPGELWVLTRRAVWRLVDGAWLRQQFEVVPETLRGAGRSLWARVGTEVFRFDADRFSWARAAAVPPVTELLAVDAAGSAWVHTGDGVRSVNDGRVPRLLGLLQDARVYAPDLTVHALVPPGEPPSQLRYRFDNGEEVVTVEAPYSLGGLEGEGRPKAFSLAGLAAGVRSLTAVAEYPNGEQAARVVYFDHRPTAASVLSFAADILPIHEARCAKCHTSGPGRDLSGYAQWQSHAEAIARAVEEKRMPADGPLEPPLIQAIQRWASSGAPP